MSEKISKIFEAKQELNQYLRDHPHLVPAQMRINEILAGAVSQSNRMSLLDRLMKESLRKLGKELTGLSNTLTSLGQK